MRIAGAVVLALVLVAACRPAGESVSSTSTLAAAPAVPAPWNDLGIPRKGLLRVSPATDAHGFHAEYAGQDRAALTSEVARGLWGAGYAQACSAKGGDVVGFVKGDRQLVVMVDVVGHLTLSVLDGETKERTLHQQCFGRKAAPPPPPPAPR